MIHTSKAEVLAILALLVGGLAFVPTVAGDYSNDGQATAKFATQSLNGADPHGATTVPFWNGSFNYLGTTYPYMMVGTDPAAGSAVSTIPTEIIPLKFSFSNGVSIDGTTKIQVTTASPIFQNASFISGTTQYGDAIQRAEFWNDVSRVSPGYHVLLGQPSIMPTVTLAVPSNQGFEFTSKFTHQPTGLVDFSWAINHVYSILNGFSPQSLPIFLAYDVYFYVNDPSNCCIAGFHAVTASRNGNGAQQVSTLIEEAYADPGFFGVKIEDMSILSHEVSEWLNDPFLLNQVPPWLLSAFYGCTNLLETGDPLVGVNFKVNGYHLQDEAFLSWFARQSPSTAINSLYTYLGTFRTVSPSC